MPPGTAPWATTRVCGPPSSCHVTWQSNCFCSSVARLDQASHTDTAAPGKSHSLEASVPIQAQTGLWPGLPCPTPHPEHFCPGYSQAPVHPPPGDPGPETSPPRKDKPKGCVSHGLGSHRTGKQSCFYLSSQALIMEAGDGCARFSWGLLFWNVFHLHISEAKMCPWVVPKANRQQVGSGPQPGSAFAYWSGCFRPPEAGSTPAP